MLKVIQTESGLKVRDSGASAYTPTHHTAFPPDNSEQQGRVNACGLFIKTTGVKFLKHSHFILKHTPCICYKINPYMFNQNMPPAK